jgi:hypothetical protein
MTHPQHCETCKNMSCIRHGIHNLYPRECDLVTESVGCASHSDHEDTISLPELLKLVPKIERECRKDEQEKVLDEAILIIEKRIAGIFDAYRGETNEIIVSRPYAMADGMGECVLMLKTFRNSKSVET